MTLKSVLLDGQRVCPSKIVCIGRNYYEHIEELGNDVPESMVIFNKPNSAITTELMSELDEPLHYETELCLLIRDGQVAAVGVGLDLTKRRLQSELKAKGLPWERAKAFDGSVLVSEFYPVDAISDQLNVRLNVDGERVQEGGVAEMIYKPLDIVRQIRSFMSLCDGDIVMTGTPRGVGMVCQNSLYEALLFDGERMIAQSQWRAN